MAGNSSQGRRQFLARHLAVIDSPSPIDAHRVGTDLQFAVRQTESVDVLATKNVEFKRTASRHGER